MQTLRGAKLIDGTGASARAADVVVDNGTIAAIREPGSSQSGEVVDLDGLVLAPGFIDSHTHYDAQILWDPDLTPSSWHGVTTAIMGNCGFSLAPTREEHREFMARTLENVEGMPLDALLAGIRWEFETYPEYLDLLERLPKRLNVAGSIGHTPLRIYVMGRDALDRAATAEEVERMREIVAEALDAGAIGFGTSRHPAHLGAEGRPVASRMAKLDEIEEIAGALAGHGKGVFQATYGPGLTPEWFSALSMRTGRPVTWTALLAGDRSMEPLALLALQQALPGDVYPQVACRPIVMQVTLADPFKFGRASAFAEVLELPHDQRARRYADPEWRVRARADLRAEYGHRYHAIKLDETTAHPELIGSTLLEIADARGVDPLDALCDIALDDDLQSRFQIILTNDDEAVLAELLRNPATLIALSDAGAHVSQLCDACWSTWLLEHWVRALRVLSLEHAVWRLSGHPAAIFGLEGRGTIVPGNHADLVAFDADRIAIEPMERVFDQPGGADRLVVRSRGIEWMWVNGVVLRAHGSDLPDIHAGRLLRSGKG